MLTGGVFSNCRKYRYALWRIWDLSSPLVLFIGLNPSTADETNNDATTIRCSKFAKNWGYGGFILGNLFSYICTTAKNIKDIPDPIGPENNHWIIKLASHSDLVVACWGNWGEYKGRNRFVLKEIPNLHCFGITKHEQPCHPLYLPGNLSPIPFIN